MVDWLYIDFNSYFASCEQQDHPKLRGKPIAVVPMMADSTSCLAASYEAKAFGVRTGTKVGEAKKMCPGLILVPSRHATYTRYHHRAIEVIDSCLPIHRVCSIDEMCCELTGSHKRLEIAQEQSQKIKRTLTEKLGVSLTVSIGLGPNMLLAKMAADMQKPNGLTWIEKEELPQKLFSLRPRDIPGIGPKMEWRLAQQGITTMEQLLSLNERQMRGLWKSVVGARYFRLLKGESFRPETESEQKSISHEHVLPPRERDYTSAGIILQKLLVKAAQRLRRGKWMTKRMSMYVRFINGTKWKFEVSFHETQDTSLMISHLIKSYKNCPRQVKPIKVGVALFDFSPESAHQLSFFEDGKRNSFFKIIDQINDKYGKDTVHLASLHDHISSARTHIAFSRIPELDELEDN